MEGLVGYARRNIMTPLPVAESFDALNAGFLDACAKRRQARLRGHAATIAERMQADVAAFMPLPPAPYDACHKVATRVSSLSLVHYHAAIRHILSPPLTSVSPPPFFRFRAMVRPPSACLHRARDRPDETAHLARDGDVDDICGFAPGLQPAISRA